MKRVVCGISGGVDSAVAAYLLKKQGMEVTGIFMRNWDRDDEGGECLGERDEQDAAIVCNQLNIPLKKVDFVKEYWNEVFSDFLKGYSQGLTPNPDVLCNKHIKFGHFHHHCITHHHAQAVATGHYVRSSFGQFAEKAHANKKARLLRAVDSSKDQSLFLSQISQHSLAKSIFPLGGMKKVEVKEIARSIGLHKIADKKESTGICFIGKRNFKKFMSQYQASKRGSFVDLESGKVVGSHHGVHQFTKGQRTLIGGLKEAYFVAERDPCSQVIYVVPGSNHPALFTSSIITSTPHWICHDPFQQQHDYYMQYNQHPYSTQQQQQKYSKQLNQPSNSLKLHFTFQHTHTPIHCIVTKVFHDDDNDDDDGVDGINTKSNHNNNINNNEIKKVNNNENIGNKNSCNIYNKKNNNKKKTCLHIEVSNKLRAVSPGQYAVLYRGDECLGSAVILPMPLPSIPSVIH